MSHELEHLELLAEIDALVRELQAWNERRPDWPPARDTADLVRRLLERTATLRIRIEAPLVVATLGGTGVGKSTLVNALAGAEVSPAGRMRPTTLLPTLICRPDLGPEDFGIDPASVRVIRHDLPHLRDIVLVDCPDPDTTEDAGDETSNLSRLRSLLPHCDVLLVVTTQQKYRSARVSAELAAAASGARLVFVQTHAVTDVDVRDDWRRVLGEDFHLGEMFFVDSAAALSDAAEHRAPRGEFGRLLEYLGRELAGSAAARIRRANFLDLADATLRVCRDRIAAGSAAFEPLEAALNEQRTKLGGALVERVCGELHTNRRLWESRLVDAVTTRWGFSPFSCLLRGYQALGSLISGYGLSRVRTTAQLALWGVFEGSRRWREFRTRREAETASERAAMQAWSESDLRTAAIIVDGYAADAGLDRTAARFDAVCGQAAAAVQEFVDRAGNDLQRSVESLSQRRVGWFTRLRYETLFILVVGALVYRFLKNFLYDSWLVAELGRGPMQPLYGLEFFLGAGVFLAAWSLLLLWSFTTRLKRGLGGEIEAFRTRHAGPAAAARLFLPLDAAIRDLRRWADDLSRLEQRSARLRTRLAGNESALGHRRG